MKYTVCKSLINVVGRIWSGHSASYRYTLKNEDLLKILSFSGAAFTRESVREWLNGHAGDFERIDDFSASIEHPVTDETITIPWENEDNECEVFDG